MASKWNNQACPLCFEGTLHDGIQEKTLEYRGRTYEYRTNGAVCDHCGDGFPEHNQQEEAAWQKFRNRVDAEEAAELLRIRKKLKLNQKEAAEIAGGGHNAFSRYERGQAKPVQAVFNLFKLLDHHPELLKELGANRGRDGVKS